MDATDFQPFSRDLPASEKYAWQIPCPLEAHAHFRDGPLATLTLLNLASYCPRAIGMPNLEPPIVDEASLLAYDGRLQTIVNNLCLGSELELNYMLGLHDQTRYQDVRWVDRRRDVMRAFKLYLKGTTTNSQGGVSDMFSLHMLDVYRLMSDLGVPLSIHLEEPKSADYPVESWDLLEEEAMWRLIKLHELFPELKIVVEHVSTASLINLIKSMPNNVVGTLAIQHALLLNADALANVNDRCKPIAKSESNRDAVRREAMNPGSKFFMGTDVAGHKYPKTLPGVFPLNPIGCWATLFEADDASDYLEGFTSIRGPQSYGLKPSECTLTLVKEPYEVPNMITCGQTISIIPLLAGKTVAEWSVVAAV
ncbi:MAG: hypothetical protein WC244_03405 [Patescibacteria group bacterium]